MAPVEVSVVVPQNPETDLSHEPSHEHPPKDDFPNAETLAHPSSPRNKT